MRSLHAVMPVLAAVWLFAPTAAHADTNAKDACSQYRDANLKANSQWIDFKDNHEDDDSKQYWHEVALNLNDAALAVNDLAKEKGYPNSIQNAFVTYAQSMRGLAEAVNRHDRYDRLERPLKSLIDAQNGAKKVCEGYWK